MSRIATFCHYVTLIQIIILSFTNTENAKQCVKSGVNKVVSRVYQIPARNKYRNCTKPCGQILFETSLAWCCLCGVAFSSYSFGSNGSVEQVRKSTTRSKNLSSSNMSISPLNRIQEHN